MLKLNMYNIQYCLSNICTDIIPVYRMFACKSLS